MSIDVTIHWPDMINPLATPTVATSTMLELPNADGLTKTVIEGTGFTYVGGRPESGTITALRLVTTTGVELQRITNVTTSLVEISTFLGKVQSLRGKLSWFASIDQNLDVATPGAAVLTPTKFTFLNSDGTFTVINGSGLDWSGLQLTGSTSTVQRYAANGTTLLSTISTAGASLAVAVGACYDVRTSEQTYQLATAGSNTHTGVTGEVVVGAYLVHDALHDGPGSDSIVGALHNSAVDYEWAPSAVVIDLAAGTATGGGGNDTLSGIDAAEGSFFDDVITGDGGANWLIGDVGNDTISGAAGNDTIIGSSGDDSLDGGADTDTVSYLGSGHAASGVMVSLALQGGAQDTGGAGLDTLTNFENLTGSVYGDELAGDGAANVIRGEDGNDAIEGGVGADSLDGGAGEDTLGYAESASAVTVTLVAGGTAVVAGGDAAGDVAVNFEDIRGSDQADTLTGDSGDNIIEGGVGADTIDGAGNTGFRGDTSSYANSATAVQVDLGAGTAHGGDAEGDVLSNIENLFGSAASDELTGDAGDNWIEGGGGADTLSGGSGSGANGDWLQYVSSAGAVTINLATASASGGDAAGDVFSGFRNVAGSDLGDSLTGDGQDNIFEGGDGADTINGAGNGSGGDTASYVTSDAAVTVNLLSHAASGGHAAGDVLSGIENLIGSEFNDALTGDAGNNILTGGNGDDTISGGANGTAGDTAAYNFASAGVSVSLALATKQDTLGAGKDVLSGIENLSGSEIADTLTGSAGNNVLLGRGGNDTLSGGLGNDTIDGGLGVDLVSYASATGAVSVNLATGLASGAAGSDVLSSIEGVVGSGFADTLTAAAAGSSLQGAAGNDTLRSGAGNDTLDGGAGLADTASYALAAQAVTVSLALAGAQATGGAGSDQLIGIENLIGSSGGDRLTGDGGNNRIEGGARNDTIQGGAGNDTLVGGTGLDVLTYEDSVAGVRLNLGLTGMQDTSGAGVDAASGFEDLYGGSGNDTLTGSADENTILGNGGDDLISGGAGADLLDGGTGINTVSYVGSAVGVGVDLGVQDGVTMQTSAGDADGDILVGFSNVIGSAMADLLTGDGGDNVLDGGPGSDTLDGAGGSDTVSYAAASAAVTVNLASGIATGGGGNDTLLDIETVIGSNYSDVLTAGAGGSHLMGGVGYDTLIGGPGSDTLDGGSGYNIASYAGSSVGVSVTLVAGSATGIGGDAAGDSLISIQGLIGGSGGDTLTGDFVGNRLDGGSGADRLSGGGSADTLIGGIGNDTIGGGADPDSLSGGAGQDEFLFDAALGAGNIDRIGDFVVVDDTIDLDTSIFSAIGAITSDVFWKGGGAHDATDRLIYNPSTGALYYDADGIGGAAQTQFATLTTALNLTSADFKLVT